MEKLSYFDKYGREVKEGDTVKIGDCDEQILYRTVDGELGVDATNPVWIKSGRAVPCEYGIYPLSSSDIRDMVLVEG
jgi:hypothetical protein